MSSLIPTHAADHIIEGLSAYVTTSFALAEPKTARDLQTFLRNPIDGMFVGPYVRTRLPHAPAEDWSGILGWLPEWFTPYRHQAEAFRRLASSDSSGVARRPSPTLVVTGTGSGKTESFLYPVLDHCRRTGGTGGSGGVKALLLYPMNALAADQERRLAELLTSEAALAGITAGIYTGEQGRTGGRTQVSESGLITDRERMRDNPPDILLTNYKMLDQLLLREADRAIWKKSAHTLQYLVLDEFHTYDAAQGTDVALLLRRLGLMLKKHQDPGFLDAEAHARPLGQVTPVVTSATLGGDGGDSVVSDSSVGSVGPSGGARGGGSMLDFAYTVFGEKFGPDAVVGETLLSVEQWRDTVEPLVGKPVVDTGMPSAAVVTSVVTAVRAAVEAGTPYDAAVHAAFMSSVFGCGESPEEAIAAMAGSSLFERILRAAALPVPLSHPDRLPGDEQVTPLVERVFSADLDVEAEVAAEFVAMALSEMAYLRAWFGGLRGWDGKKIPGVETHLWVREVSRVDRAVTLGESDFRWSDAGVTGAATMAAGVGDGAGSDDEESAVGRAWLPACYCRYCGRSGWIISVDVNDETMIETSPQKIRSYAVRTKERSRPLIDATSEVAAGMLHGERGVSKVRWLDMELPVLQDEVPDQQKLEQGSVVPVLMYTGDDVAERARKDECPSCGEEDAIRFLGSSVATLLSVALSNLFGMDDLDSAEKKTLVFADSVQDAAHRAGFVGSRARAFAVRALMNRVVESGANAGVPVSVLGGRMLALADGVGGDQARRRARFELLPPQLVDHGGYKALWEEGAPEGKRRLAFEQTKRRLELDAVLEFGARADLPRSLVSTGTLLAGVDVTDEQLRAAAAAATPELILDEDVLVTWARGVVEQIRLSGGINHPWFSTYLHGDCNPYLLNRRQVRALGMPPFHWAAAPKFPRGGRALKGGDGRRQRNSVMSVSAARGWYAGWTSKVLGISAGTSHNVAYTVTRLFDELVAADILGVVESASNAKIYYLAPERIRVAKAASSRPAELLECTVCRKRVGVDTAGLAALDGAPCFGTECAGSLSRITVESSYYQRLYRSHNSRVVTAREHTSLVAADERKRLEAQFKEPVGQQAADAPNVLVATPTLEMGIDIGDLSTVMLSSMPHSVASYVQRVGRAGRLSGNSLVVALVRGRGRALSTLEYPLETIAGAVTPPAAYLSAREILHRQFVAYLVDCHPVATEVGKVTTAYDVFSATKYPLYEYLVSVVAAGIEPELGMFADALGDQADEEVIAELHAWVRDDSATGLRAELMRAARRWQETQRALSERLSELEKLFRELEQQAGGSAADEDLNARLRATQASERFTRKQLNAVADEFWVAAMERYGLLPNFTLLDESVEFHLSVTKTGIEEQQFVTEAQEYSRGISSALTELALGNTFYVSGVAATVDSVDLGDQGSAITHWRVCPACSFSTEVPDTEAEQISTCPNCGAAAFADRDQIIDVVEMTRVYAAVDEESSAIRDRGEERISKRYQTQMTFSVPDGGRGEAWYLKNSGFGMEYLPHVNMRWLNLGAQGGGNKRMLAGAEQEAPLFRVCRHCGHADSEAGSNSWKDHRPWCRKRNAEKEDSVTFALGRKLSTQGVLVHLPALFGAMEPMTVPSLIAALKLGFKVFLGGNPDHLDIEGVREPSGGIVTSMLLVHDTVPGGTGYLAQFTDPATVHAMLEAAYRRLVDCRCAGEERQACPECLLPYARSSQVSMLSRDAAVAALAKILADDLHIEPDADVSVDDWKDKVTVEQPVSTTKSQLEVRFIEQLRQDLKDAGAKVAESTRAGHAHWTIEMPGSPHRWRMEEQKDLKRTIPDVVFSTEDPSVRDIAVYLDGEAFHHSQAHDRVADDFAKRNGLVDAGYLPWTLTWRDLDQRVAARAGSAIDRPVWQVGKEQVLPTLVMKINQEEKRLSKEVASVIERDGMSQLLAILQAPMAPWQEVAYVAANMAVVGGEQTGQGIVATYLDGLKVAFDGKKYEVGLVLPAGDINVEAWRAFVGLANVVYLDPALVDVRVLSEVESRFMGTGTAVGTGGVGADASGSAGSAGPDVPAEWRALLDEFDGEDDIVAPLTALAGLGLPGPDADTYGEEVAGVPVVAGWAGTSAASGSLEVRAALVYPGELADVSEALSSQGWCGYDLADPDVGAELKKLFESSKENK